MSDVEQMEIIELDKFTQLKANFPEIREPRWHDNKIIINARVGEHNKVHCIYEKSDGSRMFPEPLYLSKRTAMKYKPFDMATSDGGTIKMRAIPIHEFKILRLAKRSIHDF